MKNKLLFLLLFCIMGGAVSFGLCYQTFNQLTPFEYTYYYRILKNDGSEDYGEEVIVVKKFTVSNRNGDTDKVRILDVKDIPSDPRDLNWAITYKAKQLDFFTFDHQYERCMYYSR